MHTREELKELQSKTLEEKIQLSTARIIEWYEAWGGQVYVSFSGGKDSTVLLDLVRKIYPDVPAVFVDTGLEFPEIREFAKTFDNVIWLKPKMNFVDVIKKYGYPIISKEAGVKIREAKSKPDGYSAQAFDPESPYNIKYKQRYSMVRWKFLLDADFNTSSYCCEVMKKQPVKRYEKESGRKCMTGMMASESHRRYEKWLSEGCNAFANKRPTSMPLAFWDEQDVLQYLKEYNIPYCGLYGDIIETPKGLDLGGEKRTGCVFCGLGSHLRYPNNFQTLYYINPKLWDYCMRGGNYDKNGVWQPLGGLGMAKVLDYINVKWWNDGDEDKRDEYRRIYHEKEEEQKKLKEQEQKEE